MTCPAFSLTVWLNVANPFCKLLPVVLRSMFWVAPCTVEAAWPATDWRDVAKDLAGVSVRGEQQGSGVKGGGAQGSTEA